MAATIFQQRRRIRFLWLASPLLILLVLFSRSGWPQGSILTDLLRFSGLILILACIAGRCWASLYVGGRKNQKLVTDGPYAYTQNPLYFFSMLGLAGTGLLFGSLLLSLLLFALSYTVFSYVVAKEEAALKVMFADEYSRYRNDVPQFFPCNFEHSRRVANNSVDFCPTVLRRTAMDASYFLLAIPAVNIIHRLQEAKVIQPVIVMY
jgi:protein-S-isoprenylcysteine O-methyltransferase Ste14